MQKIKMIVMDLDGTLLTSQRTISPYTKNVLIELQKNNISIILATGRIYDKAKDIGKQLEFFRYPQSGYICVNGLRLYDNKGQLLYQKPGLSYKDVQILSKYVVKYHASMRLVFENHVYIFDKNNPIQLPNYFKNTIRINNIDDIPLDVHDQLLKIVIMQSSDKIDKLMNVLKDLSYEICKVENDSIEITPLNVNKGNGLIKMSQLKHIDCENVIAFGNGENDISMLKAAGRSIAMGNAFDNVKQISDDVCLDHDSNGIGIYLSSLMPKKDVMN
ncbi:MAG: Cof-type HAD-IIB family hydrolase [Erysipelotrichaceae bacterium]|nr:Cof-type HAD-IIB family hydrolase [Erysipelotrichaceae bacterium]